MTLLELLEKNGAKIPEDIWDYRVYAPLSLDDEARIIVSIDKGKTKRVKTISFELIIKDVKLEEYY